MQAELAALSYKKTALIRVRDSSGRYTFGASGDAEVVSARGCVSLPSFLMFDATFELEGTILVI